jgi:hypothetical protein
MPALQAAVASSQVLVGQNQRVAIGVVNAQGTPVAYLKVTAQVLTLPPGGAGQAKALGPPQDAPYNGGTPGHDVLQGKGVYVIHQTFSVPGFYRVQVHASDAKSGVTTNTQASFQVLNSDPGIPVGSAAPKTQNPTGDPAKDPSLDTGVPPDDMHYTTVAAAIAAHHPVVVYLGTPAFCKTKTCGPVDDVVKAVEPSFRPAKGVDFVHIETYKGGQPDNTDLNKATVNPYFAEWFSDKNAESDPWVYVINKDGLVAAKFDGPTGTDELNSAIAAVAG